MTGTRFTIGVALVAILGLVTPAVWADQDKGYGHGQGYEGGCGGHGGYGKAGHHTTGHYLRHLLYHQKEIGLTDEQVGKIKALQLDLDKTRIKAEADILIAERELHALLEDEKSELAAIEAKVNQSEGLESALRIAAIKVKREAKALLTPEQREKETAQREKMMKMMMERHREGKSGGMGHGMMGEHGPGGEKKESGH